MPSDTKKISHVLILLIFAFSSCALMQNTSKITQEADLQYYQKDYLSAFDTYSKVIESYTAKKQTVPGEIYASAGKCLYYSDSKASAMDYFQKAEDAGFADEQVLLLRIRYYASIDNLSKELNLLESYSALYSDGSDIDSVNYRLFLRYLEIKEYRKSYLRFKSLSEELKDDIDNIEKYHLICEKLGKQDEADKVALDLYNRNPNNLIGLSYVAHNAYITTETEYVAAVKAYEAKKTNATYRVLKQKTEPLVARYRKAKEYYVKLYNLYKRPNDAAILARICTRLNEKSNAAYYEKLSKK